MRSKYADLRTFFLRKVHHIALHCGVQDGGPSGEELLGESEERMLSCAIRTVTSPVTRVMQAACTPNPVGLAYEFGLLRRVKGPALPSTTRTLHLPHFPFPLHWEST